MLLGILFELWQQEHLAAQSAFSSTATLVVSPAAR
jgi:hypothetical protein